MEVWIPAEECPDVILFFHFGLFEADEAIASEAELACLISGCKAGIEIMTFDSAHEFELHLLTPRYFFFNSRNSVTCPMVQLRGPTAAF